MSVAGTTDPKHPRPHKVLMSDGSFLFADCGATIAVTTPPTKLYLNTGTEGGNANWQTPTAQSYQTQQYGIITLNSSGEIVTNP